MNIRLNKKVISLFGGLVLAILVLIFVLSTRETNNNEDEVFGFIPPTYEGNDAENN